MRLSTLAVVFTTTLSVQSAALSEENDNLLNPRAWDDAIRNEKTWVSDSKFRDSILKRSNQYRKAHAVKPMIWNTTLSQFAKDYLNSNNKSTRSAKTKAAKAKIEQANENICPDFAHSGGPYGENLAIGYGTPTLSVSAWGDERELYNFTAGQFGHDTGHFTQLVWKATRQVGCARKYCTSDNTYRGWYLACEYWPRGNIIGYFTENVLQNGYKPPTKPVEKPAKKAKSPRDLEEREDDEQEEEEHAPEVGEPLAFLTEE